MKVWVKYLIGIALGVLTAVFLPVDSATGSSVITFLTELFIRFGRYLVVPVIFSSAIVAINKLRSSKILLKSTAWTAGFIVISSLLLAFVGLVSILIAKLPRIPITNEIAGQITGLDVKTLILSLFPYSAFDTLREGSFLLVAFLFGSLIGWESASELTTFKPVFALADSLSQLFYHISVFFTEIMAIFSIAIMCNWTITFRAAFATGIYTSLVVMLIIDFVIIAGLIYPLIIRFVCHDPHPYRVLYASLAPMMLSFISGDSNLVLPLTIRHGKESLGIKRRISGFTYPLFSVFARGGSAMVAIISFIMIWRSYTALAISFSDIIWVFFTAFGLSFLLGGTPSGGSFILLTIICTAYGKGFETSYLLLQPAAVILCSFATLLDTATAMFGSYVVSVKTKMVEHHSITHFI
ncbi:MAG: cation:dicarboxylase symporter family transporter [Treponema sp.]|nr:cation:dicarboxylase symporter family transporter [Treponema sp.]